MPKVGGSCVRDFWVPESKGQEKRLTLQTRNDPDPTKGKTTGAPREEMEEVSQSTVERSLRKGPVRAERT